MKNKTVAEVFMRGWNTRELFLNNSDWSQKMFIPKSEIDKLKKIAGRVVDKAPAITKGTKVLIDKSSEVSRAKFKEFLSEAEAKKVTSLDKADVVFIRTETVQAILAMKTEVLQMIADSDLKKLTTSSIKGCLRIDPRETDQEYLDVKSRCKAEEGTCISAYRNSKQIDVLYFIEALGNTKATLVLDSALTQEINKEGLDLDDEIHETLEGMLLSKDTETFQLGIEMLSNVNLSDENLFRISLLLNSCYTRTYRLNSLSSIKNKNFRNLLNYLQLNHIKWNQRWEVYGMSMLTRFRGTSYEKNIKQYIVENLNKKFSSLLAKEEMTAFADIVLA